VTAIKNVVSQIEQPALQMNAQQMNIVMQQAVTAKRQMNQATYA
jgi:hypothetical protein